MTDQATLLKQYMDEAAIRNAIARFADAATRADYDMFKSTWAENPEFIIGEGEKAHEARGVDAITALFGKARSEKEFFVQFAIPGVIEIEGDTAITRTMIHESASGAGGIYYRNHAVAFDRLKRSGDDWKFTSRSFQYLWLDTTPFSGNGFPLFPDNSAKS